MTVMTLGSREARARWRDLLDAAHTGSADIVIQRSGRPVAAMIPYADYEALVDELNDLRANRRAIEAYREWQRDPSTARAWEEVRFELLASGRLDG